MNCSAAIFTLWSSFPSASAWRSLARKPCGRKESRSKILTEAGQSRKPLHDENGHKWLLTFLRPDSSPSTFSSFFAVCSTVFSMSFSFLSSASSSGLFCWTIIVSIWFYVHLNVRDTFVKALPAFQSSWVCSRLSPRRWTDSLPCPLVIFLRFHCGHIKVKAGYFNWNRSVA